MTDYIEEHPGGDVICNVGGVDATEKFANVPAHQVVKDLCSDILKERFVCDIKDLHKYKS